MHHCHIRVVEQRLRDIFVGVQYSAGIKRPVFDSSQFKDLDLDCRHGQTGKGNQGSSSAFITSSIGIRYPVILKGPMDHHGPFQKTTVIVSASDPGSLRFDAAPQSGAFFDLTRAADVTIAGQVGH